MERILISKLIETLSKNKPAHGSLRVAHSNDYDCYYLSARTLAEDRYDEVIRIGYSQHVHLEGMQFISVCVLRKGKIVQINLDDYKHDLSFLKKYLQNQEGKAIFVLEDDPMGA